jgi:ATP-dependent 26S proteasome regulatory subunit
MGKKTERAGRTAKGTRNMAKRAHKHTPLQDHRAKVEATKKIINLDASPTLDRSIAQMARKFQMQKAHPMTFAPILPEIDVESMIVKYQNW